MLKDNFSRVVWRAPAGYYLIAAVVYLMWSQIKIVLKKTKNKQKKWGSGSMWLVSEMYATASHHEHPRQRGILYSVPHFAVDW